MYSVYKNTNKGEKKENVYKISYLSLYQYFNTIL